MPGGESQHGGRIGMEGERGLPSHAMTRNSSSLEISCAITSGKAVTICCSGDRSALFLNSKSPIARDKARLPLTRPKSTKPPAALMRAFSAVEDVNHHRLSTSPCSLTFILGFVIKRQRFGPALDPENSARISRIGLFT